MAKCGVLEKKQNWSTADSASFKQNCKIWSSPDLQFTKKNVKSEVIQKQFVSIFIDENWSLQ